SKQRLATRHLISATTHQVELEPHLERTTQLIKASMVTTNGKRKPSTRPNSGRQMLTALPEKTRE
ncbi:hypothetical protein U1Q18_008108, partial [Sarracenia purpurea var. burkii]